VHLASNVLLSILIQWKVTVFINLLKCHVSIVLANITNEDGMTLKVVNPTHSDTENAMSQSSWPTSPTKMGCTSQSLALMNTFQLELQDKLHKKRIEIS